MRSYDEIAERVLKRRDEYVEKRKRKFVIVRRNVIAAAALGCAVLLGVGLWNNDAIRHAVSRDNSRFSGGSALITEIPTDEPVTTSDIQTTTDPDQPGIVDTTTTVTTTAPVSTQSGETTSSVTTDTGTDIATTTTAKTTASGTTATTRTTTALTTAGPVTGPTGTGVIVIPTVTTTTATTTAPPRTTTENTTTTRRTTTHYTTTTATATEGPQPSTTWVPPTTTTTTTTTSYWTTTTETTVAYTTTTYYWTTTTNHEYSWTTTTTTTTAIYTSTTYWWSTTTTATTAVPPPNYILPELFDTIDVNGVECEYDGAVMDEMWKSDFVFAKTLGKVDPYGRYVTAQIVVYTCDKMVSDNYRYMVIYFRDENRYYRYKYLYG